MLRNSDHDTPPPPRDTHPTHTMEPTLQCVVDTGRPALLANRTVNAAPTCDRQLILVAIIIVMVSSEESFHVFTSIVNPLVGVMRAKS